MTSKEPLIEPSKTKKKEKKRKENERTNKQTLLQLTFSDFSSIHWPYIWKKKQKKNKHQKQKALSNDCHYTKSKASGRSAKYTNQWITLMFQMYCTKDNCSESAMAVRRCWWWTSIENGANVTDISFFAKCVLVQLCKAAKFNQLLLVLVSKWKQMIHKTNKANKTKQFDIA